MPVTVSKINEEYRFLLSLASIAYYRVDSRRTISPRRTTASNIPRRQPLGFASTLVRMRGATVRRACVCCSFPTLQSYVCPLRSCSGLLSIGTCHIPSQTVSRQRVPRCSHTFRDNVPTDRRDAGQCQLRFSAVALRLLDCTRCRLGFGTGYCPFLGRWPRRRSLRVDCRRVHRFPVGQTLEPRRCWSTHRRNLTRRTRTRN
jgi:hypothetical protein